MPHTGYHALVVGVGSVGSMAELTGAQRDAQRFADWASTDYGVTRLIDAPGRRIRVSDIQDAIDAILADRAEVARLLIYFSGHGTALPDGDYWLLSDFFRHGDECINVALSLRTAREHPIRQIGVVADACRSTLPDTMIVNGRNVFPRAPIAAEKQPRLDTFFATRPGQIAQEVVSGDSSKVYGVFSDCVLDALTGAAAGAIEAERHVVSSQSLAEWLEDEVPERSGIIPGGIVQYPAVDHGWARPEDWYVQVPRPKTGADKDDSTGFGSGIDDLFGGGLIGLQSFGPNTSDYLGYGTGPGGGGGGDRFRWAERREKAKPAPKRKPTRQIAAARAERAATARHRQQRIAQAEGRPAFETRQGFTIVGAEVVRAVGGGGSQPEVEHSPGESWHVRCNGEPQSVAIALADGRWIGAIALPEFVGTIVVDDTQVLGVTYTPAVNSAMSTPRDSPAEAREAAARWSAQLSIGATLQPAELRRFARTMRRDKSIDPSLGILAAYVYDQGGAAEGHPFDSVDSVAWHMAAENGVVPFDVAFLSSADLADLPGLVTLRKPTTAHLRVAGTFPAMTQGWSLLEAEQQGVGATLIGLRRGLLPGVWTSFAADAGAALADALASGELR